MRASRKGLVALGVVAVMVGAGVLSTLRDAGAFREVVPHGLERCQQVPGVTGSEDLVFDVHTGVVLGSSTDFRALSKGGEAAGFIFAWRPGGEGPARVPSDFGKPFHPHGLGLLTRVEGPSRLFVVNHPRHDESTVELFDVLDGPRLVHVRSVASPEFVSLNDVAPIAADAFYATLDAGTRAATLGRAAETFLRLPWAGVVFFDGKTARRVVEGLRYSNGIALSADLTTLFVTETTGRRLLGYSIQPSGDLVLQATLDAETGLDNISVAADGALWIAAHPKMLDFLGHAGDPAKRSPSQVLRVTYDGARFTLAERGLDDGVRLSGSSVALPLAEERLVVGSVFERHLLVCATPRESPER